MDSIIREKVNKNEKLTTDEIMWLKENRPVIGRYTGLLIGYLLPRGSVGEYTIHTER